MAGFGRLLASGDLASLRETNQQYADSLELLTERLAELELSLEDRDWQRLSGESDRDFSRAALRKINALARLYWIKNPIIKQGVAIQTRYVFGQGMTMQARNQTVNEVLQAFADDPKNQAELTTHQARMVKETELQLFSNVFFVFFTNVSTGRVRIRTIHPDEVEDVIYNPEDSKEPWYYVRTWQRTAWSPTTGQKASISETAYYPDWRYKPIGGHPTSIGGHPVRVNEPVYHVAVNKLSDMRFGVSEVYASIDWVKAYKDFLTDWATIVRSYSRFAWQMTTKGGARGVAAAKTKLGTTLSASSGVDRNPPPIAGSTFVNTEGVDMKPIKTAGATTSADDGRRLMLMGCAGLGIFEHYFGDPSTGNLATATAMERPMELMFRDRQTLWADVHRNIANYVIDEAVRAPNGKLQGGSVTVDDENEDVVTMPIDETTGEPMDRHVDVDFPPLLQKNTKETIDAIVTACTLNGGTPQTMDLKTVTKLLLLALGEDEVDEVLEHLFGTDDTPGTLDQEPPSTEPADVVDPIVDQLAAEVRRLAEAISAIPVAA